MNMKSLINLWTPYLLVLLLATFTSLNTEAQSISIQRTAGEGISGAEEVVQKMVEAHGGMSAWLDAPSFSYTQIEHLFFPVGEERTHFDNWRHSTVTIEPRSSRGYATFPSKNNAYISADGRYIWNKGYDHTGNYQNDPILVVYLNYSFLAMPWLTQLDGTNLEYLGEDTLPYEDGRYHTVRITFDPNKGKAHHGYYILYIDPVTFLLKGIKHTALLPKLYGEVLRTEINPFPQPNIRIFDRYAESNGMIVPTSFVTYSGPDLELTGIHLVESPTFTKPFDESRMQIPAEAVKTDV